jgi:hypothetical protein
MGKIIGISGRKQAGKNTVANIMHGICLKNQDLVQDWAVGSNGELIILTSNDKGVTAWGEFDVSRKDSSFIEYAELQMWPFIKLYSFADSLKKICTDLFEIPYECVWGTNKQKDKKQSHLKWANMPGCEKKRGCMTSREFMQFFGTEIMRKIHEPIWINSCIKKIQQEQSEISVIADVRFPNEVKAIQEAGGIVIRLDRDMFHSDHPSEVALDENVFNWSKFDEVISNKKMSIDELCHNIKTNRKIWS